MTTFRCMYGSMDGRINFVSYTGTQDNGFGWALL
jgi:hypothetical protein